jgi:hypothetical protein
VRDGILKRMAPWNVQPREAATGLSQPPGFTAEVGKTVPG